MRKKLFPIGLMSAYLISTLVLLNCAGMVSEMAPDNEALINSYKKQIDYGVTWKAAMKDYEKVKGKVVKWDGSLVEIRENKIQVFGRGREEFVINFIVELDHPLPKEQGIGDMTQTVAIGNTVWVVGKIIDKQDYVTRTGVNLTLPLLKGYMITRDNDRDFKKPLWVANQ